MRGASASIVSGNHPGDLVFTLCVCNEKQMLYAKSQRIWVIGVVSRPFSTAMRPQGLERPPVREAEVSQPFYNLVVSRDAESL